MARFPELTRDQMTDAQKRAYDGIVSGPRGGARGPFNVLLRSPELADTVQRVGAYLRFNSSLPARLNELAIIVNARHVSLVPGAWTPCRAANDAHEHRPLQRAAGGILALNRLLKRLKHHMLCHVTRCEASPKTVSSPSEVAWSATSR
jgi:hypothetical protein